MRLAAKDPTWASMTLAEEHFRSEEQKKLDLKHYRTRSQIMNEYFCTHEQACAYTVGKESMPHPDHPNDEFFRLFKVFGGKIEEHAGTVGSKTSCQIQTQATSGGEKTGHTSSLPFQLWGIKLFKPA